MWYCERTDGLIEPVRKLRSRATQTLSVKHSHLSGKIIIISTKYVVSRDKVKYISTQKKKRMDLGRLYYSCKHQLKIYYKIIVKHKISIFHKEKLRKISVHYSMRIKWISTFFISYSCNYWYEFPTSNIQFPPLSAMNQPFFRIPFLQEKAWGQERKSGDYCPRPSIEWQTDSKISSIPTVATCN